MAAKILRPAHPRKRWFRTVLPCNLALACFSLALCLCGSEAGAMEYKIGEGQKPSRLQELFSTGSTNFGSNDTITLYDDDSTLIHGVINTTDPPNGVLTICSSDDAIRTIQQGSGNTPETGGLFQVNNTNMSLVLRNLVLAGGVTQGALSKNSGNGGAIYGEDILRIQNSSNVTFSNNQAQSAGANDDSTNTSDSGWGGALSALNEVNLNNVSNMTFQDNQAIGGNTSGGGKSQGSGQGGAIGAAEVTIDGNSSHILFDGNKAIGGGSTGTSLAPELGAESGWGGAIYGGEVNIQNVSNITFQNNQAIGGDATGLTANSSLSGWGGAIAGAEIEIANVNGITFQNNRATGGIVTGVGDTAISGLGGAIAGENIFIHNSQNVVFQGNQAIGGYDTTGNVGGIYTHGNSGLGGAIFSDGWLYLENVVFLDNSATTRDSGDISSGRGGAVFVAAVNQPTFFVATSGRDMVFSGNTHNPGKTGTLANSIYFGNYIDRDASVSAEFHADANSRILMYDPMASQVDDLNPDRDPNDGINNEPFHNITLLNIRKTGDGTWLLAGHNDMQSSTIWTVEDGTLHLGDNESVTAHIDLSHDETATFSVLGGATLELDPLRHGHRVSALDIDLQNGSVVRIDNLDANNTTRALYAPALNVGSGHRELLHLDSSRNPQNNSILGNDTSGTFARNAYDHSYSNLGWNTDRTILSADFTTRLNPDRGAISATTAPTAIAVQQPFSSTLFTHMDRLFRNVPQYDPRTRRYVDSGSGMGDMTLVASRDGGGIMTNFAPSAGMDDRRHSVPNNFWFTPGYTYTNQSGASNYDIKTPFVSAGYDRWVENSMFVGAALFYSQPDYDSSRADVEADSFSVALYGGGILTDGLELSTFVSYGVNDLDQTRRVYNLRYNSDYDTQVWSFGFGLGMPVEMEEGFTLRPFASYEFIHADVEGYRETPTTAEFDYALDVQSHEDAIHRVQAGLGLDWQNEEQGVFFNGRAYYLGLYGDTEAATGACFVMDPARNSFTSVGDEMDEHSFGLGLQLGVSIIDGMDASLGYNLLIGDDSTSHQGNVNLLWRF